MHRACFLGQGNLPRTPHLPFQELHWEQLTPKSKERILPAVLGTLSQSEASSPFQKPSLTPEPPAGTLPLGCYSWPTCSCRGLLQLTQQQQLFSGGQLAGPSPKSPPGSPFLSLLLSYLTTDHFEDFTLHLFHPLHVTPAPGALGHLLGCQASIPSMRL